jgi:hypothetical protein
MLQDCAWFKIRCVHFLSRKRFPAIRASEWRCGEQASFAMRRHCWAPSANLCCPNCSVRHRRASFNTSSVKRFARYRYPDPVVSIARVFNNPSISVKGQRGETLLFPQRFMKCTVPSSNPTTTLDDNMLARSPGGAVVSSDHVDIHTILLSNTAAAVHVQQVTASRAAFLTRSLLVR